MTFCGDISEPAHLLRLSVPRNDSDIHEELADVSVKTESTRLGQHKRVRLNSCLVTGLLSTP